MKASLKTALIAAVVSGVVSASAAVATTQTFVLGTTNRVNAASSVTNLQADGTTVNPVDAPLLTLENTSTTTNATPLSLLAAPNHPPLKVNSQTRVANLNSDKLDGVDSSGFMRGPGASRWAIADLAPGEKKVVLSEPPPRAYSLSAECPPDLGNDSYAYLTNTSSTDAFGLFVAEVSSHLVPDRYFDMQPGTEVSMFGSTTSEPARLRSVLLSWPNHKTTSIQFGLATLASSCHFQALAITAGS